MAQNDPKGSKWNPYTERELFEIGSNNWLGGWVQYLNDTLSYVTSEEVPYSYHEGSKEDPYPEETMAAITQENSNFWPGGWVSRQNDDILYYNNSNFLTDKDGDENPMGSILYPCPIEVYENMCKNGIWDGGYVTYEIGNNSGAFYVNKGEMQNSSGSGCGSGNGGATGNGSGSGSGSGSGEWNLSNMTSGSTILGDNDDFRITLSWEPDPKFTFKLEIKSDDCIFILEENTLAILWYGQRNVQVTGFLKYTKITRASVYVEGETYYYHGYLVTNVQEHVILHPRLLTIYL